MQSLLQHHLILCIILIMVQKETKKTKEQNRFFKVCYLGSVKDEKEFEIINKNFSILEQTIKIKYFIPQKLYHQFLI